MPRVQDVTHGTYQGSINLTWDGNDRVVDPVQHCYTVQPAPPGTYTARFCLGSAAPGNIVENPFCTETAFTFPTDDVVMGTFNNGG
jgi:hypothetical protein